MFKDRIEMWIIEYIVGGLLVIIPLTKVFLNQPILSDTHIFSIRLFVVCLGVILISCASSMRQRLLLVKRIDKLVKRVEDNPILSSDKSIEINQGFSN